jgi:subtilisin family serine protease
MLPGHLDAHDGSDSMSLALNDATGPGRLVVVAAGNDGSYPIHAKLLAPAGSTTSTPLYWQLPDDRPRGDRHRTGVALLAVCPATPHLQVSVENATTGTRLTLRTDLSEEAGTTVGGALAYLTVGRHASDDQLATVLVELEQLSDSLGLDSCRWRLVFDVSSDGGDMEVEAWSRDACLLFAEIDRPGQQAPQPSDHASQSTMIARPGAATSTVAVGALASRTRVRSEDLTVGGLALSENFVEGRVCDFSNPGPTRDGRQKPEVIAPGALILSARSSHIIDARDAPKVGRLSVMAGTSQAAPMVAGLLAIALQHAPGLDPPAARRLLRQLATPRISRTPAQYAPKTGFGEVTAERLVDLLQAEEVSSG